MSAYSVSNVTRISTDATAYITGSICAVSTKICGRVARPTGSRRARSRARPRLAASTSAPATWPPSSGSSGSRLKKNSSRLTLASRPISV